MTEFMKDNQRCFNYANLSIVWILVEIVTFFLGIVMVIVYFCFFNTNLDSLDNKKKSKKKSPNKARRNNDVRFSHDTVSS